MSDGKEKKMGELNEMSLDELQEKKKQVTELLATLEDEYRNAAISEESYKQAKGSNAKKLGLIKKKLEEFGIVDSDTHAPAPSATKAAPSAAQEPKPLEPVSQPSPPEEPPAESRPVPSAPSAPVQSAAAKIAAALGIGRSNSVSSEEKQRQNHSSTQAEVIQSFDSELHKLDEKLTVEVERVKTTIDAMKESRSATDERMQRMIESIAELRSMIFQRETAMKNYDIKLEKMSEAMADIEPQKIAKEFSKRDKSDAEVQARLEKLERKTEDMMKSINETNALIKSVGGLENVANVDREIAKKMARIEELTKSVGRLSEKTERMFVEINKNLEEFILYKVRQENIETMVEDLMKTSDKTAIRFENYLEKKELAAFRDGLNNLQKQFDVLRKYLKKAAPFLEAEIPKELLDLQRQKEDIESLVSTLRAEYEQKKLSESDYRPTMEKNEAKLAEIDKKISEAVEKLSAKTSGSGAEDKQPLQEKGDAKAKGSAASATAPLPEKKSENIQSIPAPSAAPADVNRDAVQSQQPRRNRDESPQSTVPTQEKPLQQPAAAPPKTKAPAKKAQPAGNVALIQPAESNEAPAGKPGVSPDNNSLLSELEVSFKQGLITKEAYEHTKKLLAASS